MPAGSVSLLISLIILIILSGFFSATETAYSCASKIKLRTLFTNGNKRAGKVLDLAENRFDNLLSTILLGNNIVNAGTKGVWFGCQKRKRTASGISRTAKIKGTKTRKRRSPAMMIPTVIVTTTDVK